MTKSRMSSFRASTGPTPGGALRQVIVLVPDGALADGVAEMLQPDGLSGQGQR